MYNFFKQNLIKSILIIFLILLSFLGILLLYLYTFNIPSAVFIRSIPKPIRLAGESVIKSFNDLPYIFYSFKKDDLTVIKLKIKEKDFNQLNNNLPDPSGSLTEEYKNFQPAKAEINGVKYKVEVRYRGETSTHWLYPKKSWRIRFIEPRIYNGMHELDLIIPHDRGYVLEAFNNYRAEKLGLKVPFSDFMNLTVNGKSNGIYFMVSHWNKETIEKMELASDTNFYGERFINEPIYEDIKYWNKYLFNPYEHENDFADLKYLLDLINTKDDKIFESNIFNIIDEDNFFIWWTHQILSGSNHQDWAHNTRLYFDRTLGKFIFIPWDVYIHDLESNNVFSNYNPLISRVLSNDKWRVKILNNLWNYVNDKGNLNEDLKNYDLLVEKNRISFYNDRLKEQGNKALDDEIDGFRALIENNFNYIKNSIKDVNANIDIYINFTEDVPVMVDFVENSFVPSKLQNISVSSTEVFSAYLDDGDGQFNFNNDKFLGILDKDKKINTNLTMMADLVPQDKDVMAYLPFNVKTKNYKIFLIGKTLDLNGFDINFEIKNQITGKNEKIQKKYFDQSVNINIEKLSLSIDEFLKNNLYFYKIDKETIGLSNAVILKDVIVPKNLKLIIAPGSNIFLAPGVSIISYSPIIAEGTEKAKISFYPTVNNKAWGNISVIDTLGESKFTYSIFNGGGDDLNGGLYTSGMLSLYNTNAEVANSEFYNAHGDDSLNVKNATANIHDNKFIKNGFDAIDFDFVKGEVSNNYFENNGNDAIDISGSKIIIKNNLVNGSGDKCISVGENSYPVIFNNNLRNCLIGIAIKDLSNSNIINNILINNTTGVDLYMKKDFFGGANANIYNTIIWGGDKRIELDEFSKVNIFNSDIEGGYYGKDNFDILPIFNEKYIITNKELLGSGNTVILKDLDIDTAHVNIGLYE